MMMLAGQAYGLSCLWVKYGCNSSITPDVNTAISRLAGFAFVGLTELYDLSICLFHAMHGGPCSMVTLVGGRFSHGRQLRGSRRSCARLRTAAFGTPEQSCGWVLGPLSAAMGLPEALPWHRQSC